MKTHAKLNLFATDTLAIHYRRCYLYWLFVLYYHPRSFMGNIGWAQQHYTESDNSSSSFWGTVSLSRGSYPRPLVPMTFNLATRPQGNRYFIHVHVTIAKRELDLNLQVFPCDRGEFLLLPASQLLPVLDAPSVCRWVLNVRLHHTWVAVLNPVPARTAVPTYFASLNMLQVTGTSRPQTTTTTTTTTICTQYPAWLQLTSVTCLFYFYGFNNTCN